MVGETSAGRQLRLSYPDYTFLREHNRAFGGLMGSTFKLEQYRLGKGANPRLLFVEFVTGNYFQVLGVRAAIGRTLLPSDEIAPGRHPVVVMSHELWQREFGGDPAIVGRTIDINRYPLTVVGVADPAFRRSVRLAALGAALGIVLALAGTGVLASLLFGVSTTDVLSFALALAIVFGGVLLATLVPAWRAARANPLASVRQQQAPPARRTNRAAGRDRPGVRQHCRHARR